MAKSTPTPSRFRTFDPLTVGTLEGRAWETYYRHEWLAFLTASIGLVRAAFGMSWPRTLFGAWLVLRANQVWSPQHGNDPDGARRHMRRFYSLMAEESGSALDPGRAAELEVEWWRVHREHQFGRGPTKEEVVDAVCNLYSYCYEADPEEVRPAAALRADAMGVSDRWEAAGRDPADPLLASGRALLIRSYAALLAVVHR